jgi:hypothetical protein
MEPEADVARLRADFETLFVNNKDLDHLRAHLGRFNPIKTMGMERMEIRHSAILGWLLNPQETHGLGDGFLRAFLSEALLGGDVEAKPSALDVSQADLMDAEIRREWRNIDLLVISPRNDWVFVIENKFDSTQREGQLSDYLAVIDEALAFDRERLQVRGIFLTLWDEEPEDTRYAPIKYEALSSLLEQHALSEGQTLRAEVRIFITHYLDVVREASGMSKDAAEMEALAKQLYRDHRRALDFIFEYGKTTDFTIACDQVIGEGLDYGDEFSIEEFDFVFCDTNPRFVSFLPRSWYDAFGGESYHWHGCEYWWSGFPMIMWFELTPDGEHGGGKLRLYAEVGPLSDHMFRTGLLEALEGVSKKRDLPRIKLNQGAKNKTTKYSKFFRKNFFAVGDIQDSEKIGAAMRKAIKSFRPEIEAIGSVLPEFQRYGQEEPSQ